MAESKFYERDHLEFSAVVCQVNLFKELMDGDVTPIRARQMAVKYLQAEWDKQRAKNAWLEEFARSIDLNKTDLIRMVSNDNDRTNPFDALMEATDLENPKFRLAKRYLLEQSKFLSRIATSPDSWSEGNNALPLATLAGLL